jgi:hypothetical protein
MPRAEALREGPSPGPAQPPAGGKQPGTEKCSKETYIVVLAMVGILVPLIARFGLHASAPRYQLPLILILLIGGARLLFDLLRRIVRVSSAPTFSRAC